MAADTGFVHGYISFGGARNKLYRVGGSLFGGAGNSSDCTAFRRWKEDGADKPSKFDDDVSILEIPQDGRVFIWDKALVPYEIRAPFFAVGSGAEIALGAMAAGASAERAVEIACEFASGSLGPVETIMAHSALAVAAE
jgi:ATP-dependent HslUV protease subunit HslV